MIAIAKQTKRFWTPLQVTILCLSALLVVIAQQCAFSQSVPLRPPIAAIPQANSSSKPATPLGVGSNKKLLLDYVQINGARVPLAGLPDTQMLTSKTGRSISVARLKQLQAVFANPQQARGGAATVVAQRGQNLRTLTTMPANARIALVDSTGKSTGAIASPAQLGSIQQKIARLSVRKTPILTPVSQPLGVAQGVVGEGLTLSDAIKRPGNQLIQVGNFKFSAEQLRLVDTQLKATGRYPGGLNDPKLPANAKGARK